MKKIPGTMIACVCFVIIAVSASMLYGATVSLRNAEYHLNIDKSGRGDILYTLKFTDHESRDMIRTIGQFIEPVRFLESYGLYNGKKFSVTMEPKGNGFYTARFGITTSPGHDYTLRIRYAQERPLFDSTSVRGKPFGIFWWAPLQWSLPVEKQIVQIQLPVEIDRKYTRPEMVTDVVVNGAGILTDRDVVGGNDRWIYYPARWHGKTHLSIHVEKNSLPPNYRQSLRFFVPGHHIDIAG
ncbi:MAG TPA: hypothetical protein PLI62_05605, partial [Spirochaetota bacterium]|nr:hypothetical protein [Spirochaetota bacterium]